MGKKVKPIWQITIIFIYLQNKQTTHTLLLSNEIRENFKRGRVYPGMEKSATWTFFTCLLPFPEGRCVDTRESTLF